MPVWRCPHCATPQPEASRCWVCKRSTTTCATCRHFRKGVAGGLGTCGLDARRPALRGSEMRACWTAAPVTADPAERSRASGGPARPDPAPARRTFVPVDPLPEPGADVPLGTTDTAISRAAAISPAPSAAGRVPGTWWLWGDPEPWPEP